MMQAEHETTSAPTATAPAPRWACVRDLELWVKAFRLHFTRKAHLAELAAARLCGYDDFQDLLNATSALSRENNGFNIHSLMDDLFAEGRLVSFSEDRMILVREFRILPDAADLFLTYCPVGCSDCYVTSGEVFDQSLCYYADDKSPSATVAEMIEDHRQTALGQALSTAASTQRFGQFHHPDLIKNLLGFLKFEFIPDTEGDDGLIPNAPLVRAGWIKDSELGNVECFSLPFTVMNAWCRDEVFSAVISQLQNSRDMDEAPIVLLNKLPQQLVVGTNTYTSLGWVLMGGRKYPFFLNTRGLQLADLLVEYVTFDAGRSEILADDESHILGIYWHLLGLTESIPEQPKLRVMPSHSQQP